MRRCDYYKSVDNPESFSGSYNGKIINCPTLLTGLSHEMRTYMNAIVAFSFFLDGNSSESEEKEENKEFINQIFNSCEQLICLFDSFLFSALVDLGNVEKDIKTISLNAILDNIIAEFRKHTRNENLKSLAFIAENHIYNSLEIQIDFNMLYRIVSCLLQNAINNTQSGYIKTGCDFSDGAIEFYILDSGSGYTKCKEFFDSDNLNEALKKFYDANSAINIILAKKLVHLMEGNILIESNGKSGTAIHFSVPVKMKENQDALSKCITNANRAN